MKFMKIDPLLNLKKNESCFI